MQPRPGCTRTLWKTLPLGKATGGAQNARPLGGFWFLRLGLAAGQSTFLPLARRAASTLRPPGVSMRALKPLTRARLRRVPSSVHPLPFFLLACGATDGARARVT